MGCVVRLYVACQEKDPEAVVGVMGAHMIPLSTVAMHELIVTYILRGWGGAASEADEIAASDLPTVPCAVDLLTKPDNPSEWDVGRITVPPEAEHGWRSGFALVSPAPRVEPSGASTRQRRVILSYRRV